MTNTTQKLVDAIEELMAWQVKHVKRWHNSAYDNAHRALVAHRSQQEATCLTCKGHGMIGGPSFYAPDEGGVPCPDCSQQEAGKQLLEMIDTLVACVNAAHKAHSDGWRDACFESADSVYGRIREAIAARRSQQEAGPVGLTDEQCDSFLPKVPDFDHKVMSHTRRDEFFEGFDVDTLRTYARNAIRAALAAQPATSEPAAYAVYWGLGKMNRNSVHFERKTAEDAAACIKSHTEIRPLFERPAATSERDAKDALTQATRDVLAERQRQISVEGYSLQHDVDMNDSNDLARAAACYAMAEVGYEYGRVSWPWDEEGWKPKDRYRNFTRAAALLIAAADLELVRSAAPQPTKEQP